LAGKKPVSVDFTSPDLNFFGSIFSCPVFHGNIDVPHKFLVSEFIGRSVAFFLARFARRRSVIVVKNILILTLNRLLSI
jgi:hypothetical protein